MPVGRPSVLLPSFTTNHPGILNPPLYLCGPTASGKSGVALALAESRPIEIINADAFQLYRGLDVLTAAPGERDRATVPHHLYGVLDPHEATDAARYRALARPVIEGVRQRGRLPVIVGGSGLYVKFLTHEPAELPSADPDLRRSLEALSLEELNRRLADLDPEEAARIDRLNPRYVLRALEVCLLTGRPVSEQRSSFQEVPEDLRGLLLQWEPALLETRIRARTAAMLSGGAIEEVAAHLDLDAPATRAIGFGEIRAHLRGEIDRATCEEQIVIATRRYAKRQRTWFRREKWLTPVPGESSAETLGSQVDRLLTGGDPPHGPGAP